MLGDSGDQLGRAAQRGADVDRAQQRRGGRGDHRPDRGEQIERVGQVAQERVPDRLGGVAGARLVDPGEQDRAHGAQRDHSDHSADHDRDPELHHRPPAIGGDEHRGAGEDQRQHQQDPGERLDVAGELGGVGEPRRGVDLGDLDVDPAGHLLRELRTQRLDRAAEHLADVGERQRGGVRVAAEDRPVHVADSASEEALEDAAADDPVDDALDQRPGTDQVRLGVQHQVVGDPARDLGADRLVVERGGCPLGELVRVEERIGGVARDRCEQQRHRREDRQAGCRDPSRPLAHGRQPTHARGGLPAAPLTSPDCSGHCSTSRSPTSDSPPSPPGFAPARRSTCARRARSGRSCSPPCSIPMRRSPTARRWWSPPTTSAPATWPAPSARIWRRGASATTRPGGPGTSPIWRRHRTSSAYASARWTPSRRATRAERQPSNGQRATSNRSSSHLPLRLPRRSRTRLCAPRASSCTAARRSTSATSPSSWSRRATSAPTRSRTGASSRCAAASSTSSARRRTARRGWSCSATRSSRSAGSRPSPSARSARPRRSSSTRRPSWRSSIASSRRWRAVSPSARTSPRCSRWSRFARHWT